MVNFDCKANGNSFGGSSSGSGNVNHGTTGGYGDSTDGGYGASTAGAYGESKYEPEYRCQQSHALSPLSTVRTEKRKSARSFLRRFLFQLNGRIVMMKKRKYANWRNGLSLSKLRNMLTIKNAVLS